MPLLSLAALLVFLSVGLGAFGAHGLRELLEASGRRETWETAVQYHIYHGLGLCVVAIWRSVDVRAQRSRCLGFSAASWVAGIAAFSGSLYALALGAPRWVGWVTPLGGVLFLAGWLALAIAAYRLAQSGGAGR
jgi:uncharacterized membrane protein YgdD (TMEM256/DUF423 family)